MAAALFLAGPAYLPPAARPAVLSSSSLRMQIARKPGEGDPFSAEVAPQFSANYSQRHTHTPAAPLLPPLRPHRALPRSAIAHHTAASRRRSRRGTTSTRCRACRRP